MGWAGPQVVLPDTNKRMERVEQLLALYRQAQTPSERAILLNTVRISQPDDLTRLEEWILKAQVQDLSWDQLARLLARHRGVSVAQAQTLMRDTIFESLLNLSKLKEQQLLPDGALSLAASETIYGKETVSESEPVVAQTHSADVAEKSPQPPPANEGHRMDRKTPAKANSQDPASRESALPRLTPRGVGS